MHQLRSGTANQNKSGRPNSPNRVAHFFGRRAVSAELLYWHLYDKPGAYSALVLFENTSGRVCRFILQ